MNIIVLMEIFREESQEELGFKYSTYVEYFRGFCIVIKNHMLYSIISSSKRQISCKIQFSTIPESA